jgi:hypothetical protein
VQGQTTKDVMVNYNTLTQKFITEIENNQFLELNFFHYQKVVFENETYVNLSKSGDPCYAKLIYEGKDFACYEKVAGQKRRTDSNKYNDVKSFYKITKTNTTLFFKDGALNEIKRKDKDLAKFFPEKNIKSLLKTHGLNIKNDEDLAKLLALLN